MSEVPILTMKYAIGIICSWLKNGLHLWYTLLAVVSRARKTLRISTTAGGPHLALIKLHEVKLFVCLQILLPIYYLHLIVLCLKKT
jgi:hypothetical protein